MEKKSNCTKESNANFSPYKVEKPFEFTKKLEIVHKPNRINLDRLKDLTGIKVTSDWKIIISSESGKVLSNAAFDLKDYFKVSMETDLDLEYADKSTEKSIYISIDKNLDERSFRIKVSDRIEIYGSDERSAAQGCYALEDEMNLNEAPIIDECDKTLKMRFTPRMMDSATSANPFPDTFLSLLAHAGFDAIRVFTDDILSDKKVAEETNDIIERAEKYGIDVYTFSTFINTKHPDDEGAFEYYDNLHGKLFDICPKLKGIILVGETCEFPSKDTRTTGKSWLESFDDEKPSPGWFPCSDYPQFVSFLRDVIRKHSPNAEIIFWSYNWGYEKRELREELIRNVPTDITMMATFEMFEKIKIKPNVEEISTDYTLWFIGPGEYYKTEAAIAKERNVRMISMTSSAGNTWDIGGVPYLPAPQRWIERWNAMTKTQDEYKMDGIRESHTYGFWPSFLPELAKYAYMVPMPDLNELLRRIIVRDYGEENVETMLEVYRLFSEGMSHCVSTNEDQYGPARVGPAYPLFFKNWELIPIGPQSKRDVNYEGYPLYKYNLDNEDKLLYETEEYKKMAYLFDEGCEKLRVITANLSGDKLSVATELLEVSKFIANTARTIHHVKRWHYLKGKLGIFVDSTPTWVGGRKHMVDAKSAVKPLVPAKNPKTIVLELIDILKREIANAEDTLPLVSANSRLGFEQEFDYAASPEQIRWKLKMAEKTLKEELLPLLENE